MLLDRQEDQGRVRDPQEPKRFHEHHPQERLNSQGQNLTAGAHQRERVLQGQVNASDLAHTIIAAVHRQGGGLRKLLAEVDKFGTIRHDEEDHRLRGREIGDHSIHRQVPKLR